MSASSTTNYHAFSDNRARPLDGTDPRGYVLHIPKSKILKAKRFWSFALRVYGPEGSVSDNTYIPPGIRKR